MLITTVQKLRQDMKKAENDLKKNAFSEFFACCHFRLSFECEEKNTLDESKNATAKRFSEIYIQC